MIRNLRENLFWDVEDVNADRDADFIIGRVLDFGDLKDWKITKDLYGIPRIKETVKKHIFTNPRSANFWSIVLDVKKTKCTKNPSLKTPRAFFTR